MNKGVLATVLAYVCWGLLPIYWKLLEELSSIYILGSRVVWSFAFCLLLILVTGSSKAIATVIKDRKKLASTAVAGVVVTCNWGIYIWAVNSGHILDASMGYYMNPLFVILFSTLLFGEKLRRFEWVSIGLAAVGVVIMVVQYGKFPWVAVLLALTFTVYGSIKKFVQMDPLTALTVETVAVFPVAICLLIGYEVMGWGVGTDSSVGLFVLVAFTGVVTAIPLLLYGYGVSTLPFSAVGFFQYISPTITLCLGLFLYQEVLTGGQIITFAFIWAGLVVYIIGKIWEMKEKPKALQD